MVQFLISSVMTHFSLERSTRFLLFLVLVVVVLVYAKPFLMPLAFGGLLAMVVLPLLHKMERAGWNRALAIVILMLGLLALVAGVVWLIVWQVSDLASNAHTMEQNITKMISQFKASVSETLGIPPAKQKEMMQKQGGSGGGLQSVLTGTLLGIGAFLSNFLLVFVYFFLLLYSRNHLKAFILKWISPSKKAAAAEVISKCSRMTQKYLAGMALMIVCLWVLYGIGFSIVGVKNPLFFAILCGLLEIVPFIGNIAGTSITLLATVAQDGTSKIGGIILTYALVQTIQSYILEPLVVGREVKLNPLFTIGGIVAGEAVWGISGMVLAIPVMGMMKIIFDNLSPLEPFGFLFGVPAENKQDKKAKNPLK